MSNSTTHALKRSKRSKLKAKENRIRHHALRSSTHIAMEEAKNE